MGLKIFMSFLALKKAFAENEEIQEMAQDNFIMLNLMVGGVWGGLSGSSSWSVSFVLLFHNILAKYLWHFSKIYVCKWLWK